MGPAQNLIQTSPASNQYPYFTRVPGIPSACKLLPVLTHVATIWLNLPVALRSWREVFDGVWFWGHEWSFQLNLSHIVSCLGSCNTHTWQCQTTAHKIWSHRLSLLKISCTNSTNHDSFYPQRIYVFMPMDITDMALKWTWSLRSRRRLLVNHWEVFFLETVLVGAQLFSFSSLICYLTGHLHEKSEHGWVLTDLYCS